MVHVSSPITLSNNSKVDAALMSSEDGAFIVMVQEALVITIKG